MTRAFLCLAAVRYLLERSLAWITPCIFAWLHCSKVFLICGENGYPGSHRSNAPPPAELRVSDGPLLSQAASVGPAVPLLLNCLFGFFAFRFQARLPQTPRSSCGSCPLSSVLSDERVTPKSRTGRLNGNTEASSVSAISRIMSMSDTDPDMVLLRVA
jgi:hypothetical protein